VLSQPEYSSSISVFFNSEDQLLQAKILLNEYDIFPRRYFYPSLHQLPYVFRQYELPISTLAAATALCLPLYPELDEKSVHEIVAVLQKALKPFALPV